MPQYLNERGEPIKVYLDEEGNPLAPGALQASHASPPPAAATQGMYPPSTPQGDPVTPAQRERQMMLDAMPGVLSMAGGAAGAIPAIVGGAVGGLIRGGPTDALSSGLVQGALEGGSRGAGKGLSQLAKFFMNSALKPGLRVVDEAGKVIAGPGDTLSSRFSDVDIVNEALQRKIPIRNKGLKQTQAAVGASRAQAMQAVQSAPVSAASLVGIDEQLEAARALRQSMADSALPGDLRKIDKLIDEYAAATNVPVAVPRVQARKDVHADAAARLYRTGKGPQKAQFQHALAKSERAAVEKRVPDIRAMNKKTQTYLALREALLAALDKESRSSRFTMSGLMDNPRLWGTVAHNARRGSHAAAISPQAVRGLSLLLSSHDTD